MNGKFDPPDSERGLQTRLEAAEQERDNARAERDLAEEARNNWREAATESANNASELRRRLGNLEKAMTELERLHDASLAETVVARRERDELRRKVEELQQ